MDMQTEIDTLLDTIKADYLNWTSHNGTRELSDINNEMIADFNHNLSVKAGRKYIKVIQNNSVWGFIVAGDNDKTFPKGTILKAAGWAAPARNHSRGNIVTGGYTIRWTGPLYM